MPIWKVYVSVPVLTDISILYERLLLRALSSCQDSLSYMYYYYLQILRNLRINREFRMSQVVGSTTVNLVQCLWSSSYLSFSALYFLLSNFFMSFLILTRSRNNTRCNVKPTILTHLLAYGLITFLTNSTKTKMTILFQILWSVVFILEACHNFQYSSNSIQLEINQTQRKHCVENIPLSTEDSVISDPKKLRQSSSSVYFEWWWSTLDICSAWSIHKDILIGKRNPTDNFYTEIV